MTSAGDVVDGVVSEVTPVGLIAEHNGTRFLIATHELSWDAISDPSTFAPVGGSVRFLVVRDIKDNPNALNTGSCRRACTKPNLWTPKSLQDLQLVDLFVDQLSKLDGDRFRSFIATQPSDFTFHALFELSCRGLSAVACTSASTLLDLNIPCPISCVNIVRDIAMSNWNVSLEQLPWYAVRQFGIDTVRESVAAVRQEALTQEQWVLLDTILYWAPLWKPTPEPPVA